MSRSNEMRMTGITKPEAISLLRTLKPLRGWQIPQGSSKISVDTVIQALETMIADSGSLEGLRLPFDEGDGSGSGGLDRLASMQDSTSEKAFEHVEMMNDVRPALAVLTEFEERVVDLMYGLTSRVPLTSPEVASILGVTQQAVTDANRQALERLRGDRSPGRRKVAEPEPAPLIT